MLIYYYSENFYNGSYYFDGSSDSLTVMGVVVILEFGTGDFTIEFWVYPTQLYTSNFIVCKMDLIVYLDMVMMVL